MGDNVSNCCLFIHLLTAALDKNLISMKSLLHRNNDRFLRNYMTSNIMRVDEIVVLDFLSNLNLQIKYLFRCYSSIRMDSFTFVILPKSLVTLKLVFLLHFIELTSSWIIL